MTNKQRQGRSVNSLTGILRTGGRLLFGILPAVFMLLCLGTPTRTQAQVTATLSGTVVDPSGSVIPGAKVTLTNIQTHAAIASETNGAGLYAFPSLVPGTYDIKAAAKGFKTEVITGLVLNAGDNKTIPALTLAVGSTGETVTVSAAAEAIPIQGGQRTDVISEKDINNLTLEGRDVTELLKVLPGAVQASGGLTQTSPSFNDSNVTVDESAVGSGMYIDGSIYRGGTTILEDGAQMIDIGDMASSLTVVDPEMTSQVTVEASNEGADTPFGPVVVSAISRSGTANFHGDAYFDARNSALNANGWQQNHSHTPLGAQHYYYPGGSIGGPVPFTHKHLLFWGGYERWLQNQGNQNILSSFIPTPEMMQGDFSMDNADNQAVCPDGFFQGKPPGGYPGGSWCSDLTNTTLANGTSTASLSSVAAGAHTVTIGGTNYTADNGQKFPAGYLDPGAAALAKIWPKANVNPATSIGNVNYYQPIVNVDNGWIYRIRLDYHLGDKTLIYGSYQQAYSSGLAQGNGAHLYWTPGNAIPYPGGGESEDNYGKTLAGHVVHTFNATTTNDFMAAWAYGSYPFVQPQPSAAYRSTLGYPYGNVFNTPTLNIPSYNSAGNETFPDFSQDSIFENPPGMYGVKKEAPQFGDTLTKVWGRHTVKMGGFTQTTDNWQSSFSYYLDGDFQYYAGVNPDAYYNGANGTTNIGSIGSQYNATAMFVAGIASSYSQNNAAPIGDVAEQNTAGFIEDSWKASRRLTLELGLRVEHVGHWYDRDHVGLAVFEPGLVQSDYYAGRYAPGFRWHATDPGIPLSGQPNRFAYADPRLGLSYDLFGNGNTVVRGGWGVYRYVTQVNTVANGEAQGTADHVLGYNSPGGHNMEMQDVNHLAYSACPNFNLPQGKQVLPPCGVQGGQIGLDPTSYGQPLTESYNFTVDQMLPWHTHLEVGYVGSSDSQLYDDAEDTEGSSFNALGDQNKTPLGALFKPDPNTGVLATNPENVTENPNFATMTETPTGNTLADYHPYGYAYGTNQVQEIQTISYANYNALQVSWTKTTGRLAFDLNGTWSKMLGTTEQANPYNNNLNYGPTAEDRPLVFNMSYMYDSGRIHAFNPIINQVLGGWTISGLTTWQQGGYMPIEFGNGVPNFANGSATLEQYTDLPADTTGASCYTNGVLTPNTCSLSKDTGVSNSIGDPTYFGTDAAVPIMPKLTCNPTQGLSKSGGSTPNIQLLNGKCFTLPAVGTQGGQNYPYMHATPYYDSDLALYRTFAIHEQQQVQLRISAFDWLNHSLPEFNSSNYYTQNYNIDYATKAISPNFNQSATGANAFGVMTVRSQLPYARVIELEAKYSF